MVREANGLGGLDPYLFLKDAGGRVLAQDDDGGGYPNARIRFRCSAAGTYTILCAGLAGTTGPFTLTVREQAAGGAPGLPPAGNSFPATGVHPPISLGTRGLILRPGQDRTLTVSLTAGQPVTFTLTPRARRGQPEPTVSLEVVDPNGTTAGQDTAAVGERRVQLTPAVSGVYQVIVPNHGAGVAAATLRQH
jgi:hypothetical protein